MSPDQWERVKDVFDEIVESDDAHRARVLSSLNDREVRSEVERLIECQAAGGNRPIAVFESSASPARLVQQIFRPRAFEIGSVLLGRFEIRTFLGAGGMGEVYEAFDPLMGDKGELVAVKTIRPSLLTDTDVVQRFRWEVQRARRVSHPNVCRVHELFSVPSEHGGEMPFMTMELLPGPTLFERVRDGPLTPAERTVLAVQICRGLQAAHDAGLVHRDLKCANIMLASGDSGSFRAVITDFGLARMVTSAESSIGAQLSQGVPGTMQYLAPELLDRIGATKKSDLYALGVILFRMAVRQYPFSETEDLAKAREERMHPPDPRSVNPDLDARWAEIINDCLQPAPANRPANAETVAAGIRGEAPPYKPIARRYVVGGIATAAAGVAVGLWRIRPVSAPPVLEIQQFASPTGNASLGKAVANLFQLTLMPSSRVRLAQRPQRGRAGPKPDWLLAGEVMQSGSGYVVRAVVSEAGSGRGRYRTESKAENAGQLMLAVHRAAIDLDLLPAAAAAAVRVANLPLEDINSLNAEALDDLTAALTEYSSGNLDLALALLERAGSKDPEFALVHVYRAIILSSMRRDHLALAPATRAFELRSRLSPRVRPHAEAVYHFMCGDYTAALAKYSEVARLYPTEVPLQRHVAQMYTILSRPADALQHIRHAIELEPENPQSLMMQILAYEDAGQSGGADRALQFARRAIPDSPFLWIAAGYSALLRDRWDEAIAAYDKVAVKPDLEAYARSFHARALVLAGRLGEAENRLKLRLGVIRHEGDRPNEDLYEYWLGQLALLNGFAGEARTHAAVLAGRDPSPPSLFPLRAAAEIAFGTEDTRTCAEIVRKVRLIYNAYPSRRCAGVLHQCAALQAAVDGRAEEALRFIAQAEEYWQDLSIRWSAAEVLRAQGKWDSALTRYREIAARKHTAIRFECLFNWIVANGRAGECCAALGQARDSAAFYDRFLFHWGSQKQLTLVRQCAEARAKVT